MEITVIKNKDGTIEVQTMDGNILFKTIDSEYSVSEPIDPVKLIRNIWNNAKIENSNLIIEVKEKG